MSTPIPSFFGSFLRVASGTFLSRVFGLIRDILFATMIPKVITDTFFVAFRIPNLFRRLFGEGALTVAFIPVFQGIKKDRGAAEAKNYYQSFYGYLCLVLLVLVGLGWLFAPEIIQLLTPGWAGSPEKLARSSMLLRFCFPYLFFISLVACFMGVLNAHHKFWIPGFSPVLLNWSFIVCIGVGFAVWHEGVSWTTVLIIAVTLGGLSQLLLNLGAVSRIGIPVIPKFHIHPGTWKTFKLMMPSVLALSSLQINIFITTIFASYLEEGSISALYFASRLVEFPLGVIAVSIAVVLLPRIGETQSSSSDAFHRALFILLPISVVTYIGAELWVRIVFGYGAFDPQMVHFTSIALRFGALSILGGGVYRIMSSYEFASQRPWVPAVISLGGAGLHLLLCSLWVKTLGIGAIALSLGIVSIIQGLTVVFVRSMTHPIEHKQGLLGLLFANVGLATSLWFLMPCIAHYSKWIQLLIFCSIATIVYIFLAQLLKLKAWQEWKTIIFKAR